MAKSAVRSFVSPSSWLLHTHMLVHCIDCGNFIGNNGAQAPASDCSFACSGNPSETCGAGCMFPARQRCRARESISDRADLQIV